jgi:pSer/pThr/pTyr-binding forkhead associated (FHA) protein
MYLKLYKGSVQGEIYDFNSSEKQEITIGRNPINDITIEDKLLSSTHCIVNFKGDTWKIKDGNG